MVKCTIEFEQSPFGVFYSGSTINGVVNVTVKKPTKFKGIFLTISGCASVHWSESGTYWVGENQVTSSTLFKGKEYYIHTVVSLCESDTASFEIDEGVHAYNFSCFLPPELPSSVEAPNAQIRYLARVMFDRPWKFNKSLAVGFTVLKLHNLNAEDPSIRLPSGYNTSQQFGWWPCKSKPLVMEVVIPQSGYVSGQPVVVKVKLYNQSGRSVEKIKCCLRQLITMTSDRPTAKMFCVGYDVAETVVKSIRNTPTESVEAILTVPPLPPTCTERTCRILVTRYEILAKAYVRGMHTNPSVSVPIFIGNIPLIDTETLNSKIKILNICAPSSSTANEGEQIALNLGFDSPKYEEATHLKKIDLNKKEKHPLGESYFLPKYPVFDFASTASTALSTPISFPQ